MRLKFLFYLFMILLCTTATATASIEKPKFLVSNQDMPYQGKSYVKRYISCSIKDLPTAIYTSKNTLQNRSRLSDFITYDSSFQIRNFFVIKGVQYAEGELLNGRGLPWEITPDGRRIQELLVIETRKWDCNFYKSNSRENDCNDRKCYGAGKYGYYCSVAFPLNCPELPRVTKVRQSIFNVLPSSAMVEGYTVACKANHSDFDLFEKKMGKLEKISRTKMLNLPVFSMISKFEEASGIQYMKAKLWAKGDPLGLQFRESNFIAGYQWDCHLFYFK